MHRPVRPARAASKRLIDQGLTRDLAAHQDDTAVTLRRLMQSEDFQEKGRAFLEKRPPIWRGGEPWRACAAVCWPERDSRRMPVRFGGLAVPPGSARGVERGDR